MAVTSLPIPNNLGGYFRADVTEKVAAAHATQAHLNVSWAEAEAAAEAVCRREEGREGESTQLNRLARICT